MLDRTRSNFKEVRGAISVKHNFARVLGVGSRDDDEQNGNQQGSHSFVMQLNDRNGRLCTIVITAQLLFFTDLLQIEPALCLSRTDAVATRELLWLHATAVTCQACTNTICVTPLQR